MVSREPPARDPVLNAIMKHSISRPESNEFFFMILREFFMTVKTPFPHVAQ